MTEVRLPRLPDMVGWELRRPTIEECGLVGRDTRCAQGHDAPTLLDDGDTVVVTGYPEAQAALARAFEAFGMCDAAHVIPAGVYLEE